MTTITQLAQYKDRLAGLPSAQFIGSILWYSIAGTVTHASGKREQIPVRITRDQLASWFTDLGLDEKFLPPNRTRELGVFALQNYEKGVWRAEVGGRLEFHRLTASADVSGTPADRKAAAGEGAAARPRLSVRGTVAPEAGVEHGRVRILVQGQLHQNHPRRRKISAARPDRPVARLRTMSSILGSS